MDNNCNIQLQISFLFEKLKGIFCVDSKYLYYLFITFKNLLQSITFCLKNLIVLNCLLFSCLFFRSVAPNIRFPGAFGLKLPEVFTSSSASQDFWELEPKVIWRNKVGNHYFRRFLKSRPGFEGLCQSHTSKMELLHLIS